MEKIEEKTVETEEQENIEEQENAEERRILDTLLQEGIDFSVSVKKHHPYNLRTKIMFKSKEFLYKRGILKEKRKFIIPAICLEALFAISKIIIDMRKQHEEITTDSNESDFVNLLLSNVEQNKDKMVKIVALAIMNCNGHPPRKLTRFLNKNLTSKEMSTILKPVIIQLDLQSFLAGTVSVGAMNLLTTKQTGGESSAESSSISDSLKTKSSENGVGQTS